MPSCYLFLSIKSPKDIETFTLLNLDIITRHFRFEGGPHPLKAQYLRLSFDTDPADIIAYIQKVWKIEAPRLVVTINGGMANFPYVVFFK